MNVAEIWRYPVKSLQGEQLPTAEVTDDGVIGDRTWALFDLDTGFGLTARRVPGLLFATGRLRADGTAEVVLPDGTVTAADAVLSEWLGRRVALRSAGEQLERRYENPDQPDESGRWHPFTGSSASFHDDEDVRVSLVSTATLGGWDRRRFRANVLLDGAGEDSLVGSRVRLGTAEVDVSMPVARCVMVTRPQPDGIEKDTTVLKTVHRERGGVLSVGGRVVVAGRVTVGDQLAVL